MSTAAAVLTQNEDTHSGISNAKLGVWLFLASEIMLFATLFTTYLVLRISAPTWPAAGKSLNFPRRMTNRLAFITPAATR